MNENTRKTAEGILAAIDGLSTGESLWILGCILAAVGRKQIENDPETRDEFLQDVHHFLVEDVYGQIEQTEDADRAIAEIKNTKCDVS